MMVVIGGRGGRHRLDDNQRGRDRQDRQTQVLHAAVTRAVTRALARLQRRNPCGGRDGSGGVVGMRMAIGDVRRRRDVCTGGVCERERMHEQHTEEHRHNSGGAQQVPRLHRRTVRFTPAMLPICGHREADDRQRTHRDRSCIAHTTDRHRQVVPDVRTDQGLARLRMIGVWKRPVSLNVDTQTTDRSGLSGVSARSELPAGVGVFQVVIEFPGADVAEVQ